MKRTIALILALVMLLGTLPLSASAVEAWTEGPTLNITATKLDATHFTVKIATVNATDIDSMSFQLGYTYYEAAPRDDSTAIAAANTWTGGIAPTVNTLSTGIKVAYAASGNVHFDAGATLFSTVFTLDQYAETTNIVVKGMAGGAFEIGNENFDLPQEYAEQTVTYTTGLQTATITNFKLSTEHGYSTSGTAPYVYNFYDFDGTPIPDPTFTYNGDGTPVIKWYEQNSGGMWEELSSAPVTYHNGAGYKVTVSAPATENYKAVEELDGLKFQINPGKPSDFGVTMPEVTFLTSDVTSGVQTKEITYEELFQGLTYGDWNVLYVGSSTTNGTYVQVSVDSMWHRITLTIPADTAPATTDVTDSVKIEVYDGACETYNYEEFTIPIKFVSKVNVDDKLTMEDKTITYDGQPHTLTALYNGAESENIKYTIDGLDQPNGVLNAGTHTVVATYEDSIAEGTIPGHIGTKTATLTIEKAKLTPTVTVAFPKTYDGTTEFYGHISLLDADGLALTGSDVTAEADIEWTSPDVGTKTVNATNIELDVWSDRNYTLTATELLNYEVSTAITKGVRYLDTTPIAIKAGESLPEYFTTKYISEGFDIDESQAAATTVATSNTAVVTVDADGTLNALAAGNAVLTVNVADTLNYDKAAATIEVTVYPAAVADYYSVDTVEEFDIEDFEPDATDEKAVEAKEILASDNVVAKSIVEMLNSVKVEENLSDIAAKTLFADAGIAAWLADKSDVEIAIKPTVQPKNITDYYYYGVEKSMTFDIAIFATLKAGTSSLNYKITELSQPIEVTVTLPQDFVPSYVTHIHENADGTKETMYIRGNLNANNEYTFEVDRFSDFEFTVDKRVIYIWIDGVPTPYAYPKAELINNPVDLLTLTENTRIKGFKVGEDGDEIYTELTVDNFDELYDLTVNDDLYLTSVKKPSSSSSGSGSAICTVTVTPSDFATINVSAKNASSGSTITVTVKANDGYTVSGIKVVDASGNEIETKGANGTYTFTMPASNVTVSAVITEGEQIFSDVANSAYYAAAVRWAVAQNITKGTTETTFAPNASCTRGQMVTFLYRAAGSPAVTATADFIDVESDAYYAAAVAWALDNGITNGKGKGIFDPNGTVTRAEALTFLYRYSKAVAPDTEMAFNDVASDAWYAASVRWGVSNNITNGTTETTFSPAADCVRAQIVTFLYRLLANK